MTYFKMYVQAMYIMAPAGFLAQRPETRGGTIVKSPRVCIYRIEEKNKEK